MELFRSLGSLVEPPGEEVRRIAELLEIDSVPAGDQHTDLFLFQLYPFASVYLDRHGKLGGEARDRIAGFWRALELTPPPEPDHLTLLLAFYNQLRDHESQSSGEAGERWLHIRAAFLWEHLVSWLPVYLAKLIDLAPLFYTDWARLLDSALRQELADMTLPEQLPLHLREAPPIADPRESDEGEDFLEALLSPVRSGLILVRDDLSRAGRDLELGVRAGERRYVLKALLGQDDKATLRWLAGEARLWSQKHREWSTAAIPIAEFWASRASDTAVLLDQLARDL